MFVLQDNNGEILPAEESRQVQIGDCVVAINDKAVYNKSYDNAIQKLVETGRSDSSIAFTFVQTPNVLRVINKVSLCPAYY